MTASLTDRPSSESSFIIFLSKVSTEYLQSCVDTRWPPHLTPVVGRIARAHRSATGPLFVMLTEAGAGQRQREPDADQLFEQAEEAGHAPLQDLEAFLEALPLVLVVLVIESLTRAEQLCLALTSRHMRGLQARCTPNKNFEPRLRVTRPSHALLTMDGHARHLLLQGDFARLIDRFSIRSLAQTAGWSVAADIDLDGQPYWLGADGLLAVFGRAQVSVALTCSSGVHAISDSLTSLEISRGSATKKLGHEGAIALAAALVNAPRLEALQLNFHSVGDSGATAVAAALSHLPCMTDLGLLGNAIGASGAVALADALVHVPKLDRLFLGRNEVGHEGAVVLAKGLANVPRLRFLQLGFNLIGDAGMAALAAALPHVPQLRMLAVPANSIGPEGIVSLAGALVHVPRLTSLFLTCNTLERQGAEALADALQYVPDLVQLGLSDLGLAHAANIKELATALRQAAHAI